MTAAVADLPPAAELARESGARGSLVAGRAGHFAGGFLARPEGFPERCGGEPWGRRRLVVRFATQTLVFSGLDGRRHDLLAERYEPYVRAWSEEVQGLEIPVYRARSDDFLDLDPRHCETSLAIEHRPGAVCLAGLGLVGRLEHAPRPGSTGSRLSGAIWLPPADERFLYMAFENYLRVLLAYRLCELGGALVHSAAVVKGGQAHLFYGHSGAGKSTLSRLAIEAGLEVLSDDFNALWPVGGSLMVSQLPYAGEIGRGYVRTDAYPLEGVYQLLQGTTSRLEPLRPMAAVAGLLACCPFVNGDPAWRERALSSLGRIARSARRGRVTSALSTRLWSLL